MTSKQDMKVYYETFPDALKECDWCNRKFRTVAGLRTHALRMHPAETAPNRKPKCSRCGDCNRECAVCGECSFDEAMCLDCRTEANTAERRRRAEDNGRDQYEAECRERYLGIGL